ncbi:MAG TPA: hypothetical protein VFF05_00770, partial [Rudaea sp.]|nr:hypothetical protein [Rudaea sp.]
MWIFHRFSGLANGTGANPADVVALVLHLTHAERSAGVSVASQLVLIVDDRITNLKILERLATSLGEEIASRTFGDPFEALAAVARE